MRTAYILIPSLVEYRDYVNSEGIVSIWLLKSFYKADFFPPKEVCLKISICYEKPTKWEECPVFMEHLCSPKSSSHRSVVCPTAFMETAIFMEMSRLNIFSSPCWCTNESHLSLILFISIYSRFLCSTQSFSWGGWLVERLLWLSTMLKCQHCQVLVTWLFLLELVKGGIQVY